MYQFLALTSVGIESLLADELSDLGATLITQKPEGVYFQGDLSLGYHVCLWSRLASRVLLKLGEGPCGNKDDLYRSAMDIPWSDHFESTSTFAIDFVGKSREIRNSQFGGLTIKDAIVDHFRDKGLARPTVDKVETEITFQARLLKGQVSFYLDFSGRSLFRRGYRKDSGAAPLKENLAAALIKRSGWLDDTSKPLIDPMCGSGTLLIEAVSMALKQAPSIQRKTWGFAHWLGHEEAEYQVALNEAKQASAQFKPEHEIKVFGLDLDSRVLKTAQQNSRLANFAHFIDFQCTDAAKMTNKHTTAGTILFNPPYGERIGDLPELVDAFASLGQLFKQQFADWRVGIFTANVELLSMLKLASFKRYKLKNGPLDCQLALYNLDEKQLAKGATQEESVFAQQDSAFANRLTKNLKQLRKWLKKQDIDCYRVYDADIPEYNAAIDVYGDHIVIQEYAAPGNIPEDKVAKRIQEVIYWAPKVLEVDTNKVSLKMRRKQKGANQYQRVAQEKRTMVVNEHGAKLIVNIWDYLDTGLFLDHRKTRQIVAEKAKGRKLLNLFSYTGSVSVQAALHGASAVTTVDMSNTYLQWAQENFAENKLTGSQYQFVQADCLQWLKQNTEKFDVIFIDPPTFSNSKRMDNTFDVQRDHIDIIKDALACLNEGGEIIFTNNKRNFKIDVEQIESLGLNAKNTTEQTRDMDFKRNIHIHNSWSIKRK